MEALVDLFDPTEERQRTSSRKPSQPMPSQLPPEVSHPYSTNRHRHLTSSHHTSPPHTHCTPHTPHLLTHCTPHFLTPHLTSSHTPHTSHTAHLTSSHTAHLTQVEEGNVEYKLKLLNPTASRFEHLVTQMKWRLQEGHGEAIYEIGVADSGALRGLSASDMDDSLTTLKRMAER